MKTSISIMIVTLSFLSGVSAFATPQHAAKELDSRALQQARRVASMENENDIPSRAVRLTQRAAKKSKIAYQNRPVKHPKSKSVPTQN